MESQAVVQISQANQHPVLIIRLISDIVGEEEFIGTPPPLMRLVNVTKEIIRKYTIG
jgi:hypothetical protein